MKVLMITGDKKMVSGHPRFDLQASAVEKLVPVYWGRGSLWPKIPQGQFDVVTAQDPFWRGAFAWFAARRIGAKFNVQVHTNLAAQNLLRHVMAQIILRHADTVRVVSQKLKEQVIKMGVRAPVAVVPIYVDVDAFKNLPRQLHAQKIILWVGRFELEKDPVFAIHVLKNVLDAGVDARLIMLGSGSLEPAAKSLAQDLPVEFAGWQDPKLYLPRADMVLSTSLHESWGASIIEALAAGVPVVAPDVGIAKEAGAIVAPRLELAQATIDALRTEVRGRLQLPLLSREEWAKEWTKSL